MAAPILCLCVAAIQGHVWLAPKLHGWFIVVMVLCVFGAQVGLADLDH